ncbi:hypothetical protein [uncultured Mediterranean phage]|nr:hypothetical protein [uncultured Mediterranean phage]
MPLAFMKLTMAPRLSALICGISARGIFLVWLCGEKACHSESIISPLMSACCPVASSNAGSVPLPLF